MTKALRTKIVAGLKKLTSWQWYAINPKTCSREEMIEVLQWCIDEGMPYAIRGDWSSFRLESIGGPLWQNIDPLPEGVTLQFIGRDDDTSFYLPNGRLYVCTGPAHVIVRSGDKIIGIENNFKKQ